MSPVFCFGEMYLLAFLWAIKAAPEFKFALPQDSDSLKSFNKPLDQIAAVEILIEANLNDFFDRILGGTSKFLQKLQQKKPAGRNPISSKFVIVAHKNQLDGLLPGFLPALIATGILQRRIIPVIEVSDSTNGAMTSLAESFLADKQPTYYLLNKTTYIRYDRSSSTLIIRGKVYEIFKVSALQKLTVTRVLARFSSTGLVGWSFNGIKHFPSITHFDLTLTDYEFFVGSTVDLQEISELRNLQFLSVRFLPKEQQRYSLMHPPQILPVSVKTLILQNFKCHRTQMIVKSSELELAIDEITALNVVVFEPNTTQDLKLISVFDKAESPYFPRIDGVKNLEMDQLANFGKLLNATYKTNQLETVSVTLRQGEDEKSIKTQMSLFCSMVASIESSDFISARVVSMKSEIELSNWNCESADFYFDFFMIKRQSSGNEEIFITPRKIQ
jgi:hypothetical protein